MGIASLFYRMLGRPVPYYANYSIWLIIWKPIRKFINVVIIPNIPSNKLRILLYRMIGFNIGGNVFIGMKCYMDDIEPSKTTIEDNSTISYGCFFACHGRGQGHTPIVIRNGAYLGMRVSVVSGKGGVEIGRRSIIGACSLVNRSIPAGSVAFGIPARPVGAKTASQNGETELDD